MSAPRFTSAWFVAHEAAKRARKQTHRIQARPAAKSEAEIQQDIAGWLRSFGRECWFVWHRIDKPSTAQVGTPDFVGWYRGQPFCLEVKKPGGKQTREQAGQLMHAELAGGKSAVVHSLAEAVEFFQAKL